MRRFSTSIAIALSILLLVGISLAQQTPTTSVPNLIRFGGVLKDSQGAALSPSTAVGVTFSVYKQQDGGAAIWLETQNVTPDANGNYNVVLGSTTATGLPSDLFSQDEQRWLGVQVQEQAEQPRVLLVSVPYAFKAHEAETLAGKSISDFVLAKDLNATNSVTGTASNSGSNSTQALSGNGSNKSPSKSQPSMGQTFFSSSLTPVVSVMQTGTTPGNSAILATNSNLTSTSNAVTGQISGAGRAIYGQALSTSAQAYGVQGDTASTIGVGLLGFATSTTGSTYGLKGYSSSTGGTGVRGLSTATTGSTVGISASVASPAGIAGVFSNIAGGKILSGQNNGAEEFSVDGSGNVNTVSTYQIGASSVLGIGRAADNNLFLGVGAGVNNVAGSGRSNVFSGYQAGFSNTRGFLNTFSGYLAGYSNTTGSQNVFSGASAGVHNTTGGLNTFSGAGAGSANTIGSGNTFYGANAGDNNTTEVNNTFLGVGAGQGSSVGGENTFTGQAAGGSSNRGAFNTFYGADTGFGNFSGSYNSFFGFNAGSNNSTGSSDIYIGNQGPASGTENNTIRIGAQGTGTGQQNASYIAGIYGSTSSSGVAVYINSDGLLGTLTSSRRFKENIIDMADSTSRLFQLRPVTFFYKPQFDDGSHTLQYGLIAEEVAKVYPDMVAYDKDGQPYTVKYQYLAPMLLNELQKQHAVVTAQEQKIDELEQRLSRLETLVANK